MAMHLYSAALVTRAQRSLQLLLQRVILLLQRVILLLQWAILPLRSLSPCQRVLVERGMGTRGGGKTWRLLCWRRSKRGRRGWRKN